MALVVVLVMSEGSVMLLVDPGAGTAALSAVAASVLSPEQAGLMLLLMLWLTAVYSLFPFA